MRLSRAAAVLAVATAAVVTAAPAASAVGPVCRVVRVGDGQLVNFSVCVTVDVTPGTTGTFTATLHVTCGFPPHMAYPEACDGTGASLGQTGFVPSRSYQAPRVDPATGSVRVYDGSVGTLYVDGTGYDVPIIGFCIGDPTFCP